MKIPDEFLREIKFRNDIEDIISRYVELKQSGSVVVGSCPFHSEKSPSFTVFTNTKTFYCFGCGAGGDVITFMMKIEDLDYVTAVTKLADFAKIPLPEDDSAYREKLIQQKRIYELNKEAAIYFHRNLYVDSPESNAALDYLHNRGLSNATIKHFGLGYALNSWDSAAKYLSGKGFSRDEQKNAFLCGMTRNGKFSDYFRGRIMFPIIDLNSNVIGFGGRSISKDKNGNEIMPKYLNTSDTPAFKKSKNLYALNFAKNSKADYFILCEGYMDVIAMHQAGYISAVASLGTAFTREHSRIIAKYRSKVMLAYDSDSAGQRAMEKVSAFLDEVGVEVKILELDGAKDPDEFIKLFGKEKFDNTIKKSKGYINNKLDYIHQKYNKYVIGDKNSDNSDDSEQKVKTINEICEVLSMINSSLEQEVYVGKVATKYNISFEKIMQRVSYLTKARRKNEKNKAIDEDLRKTGKLSDRINLEAAKNPRAVRIEEAVIGCLLLYPELYKSAKNLLSPSDFITGFSRKVFEVYEKVVEEHGTENFDMAFITREFSVDESGRITKMSIDESKFSDSGKERLETLIYNLKEENDKQNEKLHDILLDNDKWAKGISAKKNFKSTSKSDSVSDFNNADKFNINIKIKAED